MLQYESPDDAKNAYNYYNGRKGIQFVEADKKVTASSVEELLVKIQDAKFEARSNNVLSEQEKLVGQKFDFSV